MASISPSPNSPPSSTPPNSTTTSPPPASPATSSPPPSNDSTNTTSPAPTTSQPNATSDPPSSSPPPPSNSSSSSPPPPTQAPPPAVPSAPPPASLSPPPPTPVVPAPEPPTSSPPPPSISSPPPATSPPVADPPTSSPPPPAGVSPPPPNRSPPPDSPSPPVVTSPPPQEASPPPPAPRASPPPPADSSPPPSNSPPPPSRSPPPPSESPPPPSANPPKSTPSPPAVTPPPSASPPPEDSPPDTPSPPTNQTRPSPPPPSVQASIPPTAPTQNNSSTNQSSPPSNLPIPTQPSDEAPNSGSTNPSPENASSSKSGGIDTGGAVAIGVAVTIVVLSLIGVALWYLRKKKKKVTGYHAGHVMPSPLGSSPASDSSFIKAYSSAPLMRGSASSSDFVYSPPESGASGNSRPLFTYEELMEVTNRFSAQNLLGEGGFGCVYKGILADGREVAVKQLKIGGSQGEREFSAEVETISRVHHRHLVSLVGYCMSEHQRLLVYDFVPNNTLHFHLHGEGRPVMDWATRVKVAIGAARGISYLHEDCHPRIIHRDIKSSNILLDNNFDAQVSDFGLAKLALDAHTHITTRVMGTFGYMAPEYASSGKLTEKSDVYSFGVVLLELITGRKPVDASQPMGDESLVEWARPLLSGALDNHDFGELVDPRLERNYVESEMIQMIEAAAACVRHSAAKRPRMGQVVRALEGIGDSSDLTNGIRPGQSEIFDPAQQSAEIRMFRRMAFGSQDYNSDMFSRSSWTNS